MRRLTQADYKKSKALKQLIKSIPMKETDKPLLRSTVKTVEPYNFDLLGLTFLMSILTKGRYNRAVEFYGPPQIKDKGRNG